MSDITLSLADVRKRLSIPSEATDEQVADLVNNDPEAMKLLTGGGPGLGSKILSGLGAAGEAVDKFTGAPARAGIRYGMSKLADATQGTDLTKDRTYSELSKPFSGAEMEGTFGKTGGKIVAEAGNLAADPTNVIPFGAAGKLVKGGAKALSKTMGGYKALAKGTTGLGAEVFEVASTRAGRKAIEGAAGKQFEIGSKLKDFAENPWSKIPEAKQVDAIIPKMGNVKLDNTLKALDDAKIPDATTDEAKAANAKIDGLIKELMGNPKQVTSPILSATGGKITRTTPSITEITAEKARNVKRQFDKKINWDDPTAEYMDKAYSAGRRALMKDLEGAAVATGNKEYIKATKAMSEKLSKIEELQGKIGKDKDAASRFVSNLFNADKEEARRIIKEIGDITGDDFISEAKLVALAKQFGKESGGKVPLLPTHTTGKALIGAPIVATAGGAMAGLGLPAATVTAPLGAALMSPAVAVRLYGTGKAASRALAKSSKGVDKAAKIGYGVGKSLSALNRAMQRRREEQE